MIYGLVCFLTIISSIYSENLAEFQEEVVVWRYKACPKVCHCSMKSSKRFQAVLRTVDCSEKGLTSIPAPEDIPSDTQVLLLGGNKIRILRPGSRLWLPDLLHLDLSRNRLSAIQFDSPHSAGIFEGVYNLRFLDFSRNHLKSLQNYLFQGLFNLEELDFSHNKLTAIPDEAFRGLLKLETLHLTANKLTYVQNSWWQNLQTLYNLNLNRNYISLIQSDSFQPLGQLLSLDISRNKIFKINNNGFSGLDKLENLQLANNALTAVPVEALKSVRKTLKSINLSRNPLFKICTDDFATFPALKDVMLANMPRLRLIERGSFKNLPQLLVVQIHDNPYLAYLDSLTFVNTPEMTHLLLHNNNLTVLERETLDSLPSLEEISFYGNPLACDCNARWLKEKLTSTISPIFFQEAERIVCNSPSDHKFKLFASLRAEDMPKRCPPRILYMFDSENTRKTGEGIEYDCRAVGIPKPHLTWITPEGRVLTPSTYHPRRVLRNGQTLVLKHIGQEDAGLYSCIAESEIGTITAQTHLNVSSIHVQIFPTEIGPTSATVTWNGTDRSSNIFQIFYRESRQETDTRHQYAGTVTPIMRSYTLRNLQPNTEYEVCIAFEDGNNVVTQISCTSFSTRNMDFLIQGIERTSNLAVGAALGIVACMLIVICLAAVGVKRSGRNSNLRFQSSFESLEEVYTPEPTPVGKATFLLPASSTESLHHQLSTDNVYSPLVPSRIVVEKVYT